MTRAVQMSVMLIAVALCSVASARADDPGRAAYLRYCSACHGENGRGDGVAASALQAKPTDLTELAKANGGTFPTLMVRDVLDGRKRLNAHGSAEMPVWGQVFAEEKASTQHDAVVRAQVQALTEYLSSIQVK